MGTVTNFRWRFIALKDTLFKYLQYNLSYCMVDIGKMFKIPFWFYKRKNSHKRHEKVGNAFISNGCSHNIF